MSWETSEPADEGRIAQLTAELAKSSPGKPKTDYREPVILSSGHAMPRVGLGTAHLVEAEVGVNLASGARHLDCARIYGNEGAVGRAVAASGVARHELFLTSKLWVDELRPSAARAAVEDSLRELGTPYLDLLLIHWPLRFAQGTIFARDGVSGFRDTWAAMEAMVASGKVRSLGVSNFDEAQLGALLEDPSTKIPPAVNQIEAHPTFPNQDLVDFCQRAGVVVVAWGPLGGSPRRLGSVDSMLWATAKMHAASLSRCALRWNLERGVVVIPKSTRAAHVKDALAATTGPKFTRDDKRLLAESRKRGSRRFPDVIGVWPAQRGKTLARALGFLLHLLFSLAFAFLPKIDAVAVARGRHARKEVRYAAARAEAEAAAEAEATRAAAERLRED